MAPEAHDTSGPKPNRVDIWSLGSILYRMFAGGLLFKDPVETWKYAMAETSTLLGVEKIRFSDPCVCFLRDVLQPSPEDRPSAEAFWRRPGLPTKLLDHILLEGASTRVDEVV